MTILIVDDSTDQHLLLQSILSKAGYRDTVTAESAQAAFTALQLDDQQSTPSIDLILMDISMPGIDGVTACRQIKQQEHVRDIPIIMVTATTDHHNLTAAFSAGAIDYITKPLDRVELLARVGSALTLKQEIDCRKEREADLRRSNEELQCTLKELKVLHGLIPICASCKNIRNDSGYWQQLEEYISEHSAATFSHGLCHPCLKKLYPGVYQG